MRLSFRVASVLGILSTLSAGCADFTRPEPEGVTEPSIPPPDPVAPPALLEFPALSRPGEVFNDRAQSYGYPTRYVLYQDSTFGLQMLSPRWGLVEFRGGYSRADSLITFTFSNPQGPPWQATGSLSGYLLTVTYNDYMLHSDFVDGWYLWVPGTR